MLTAQLPLAFEAAYLSRSCCARPVPREVVSEVVPPEALFTALGTAEQVWFSITRQGSEGNFQDAGGIAKTVFSSKFPTCLEMSFGASGAR